MKTIKITNENIQNVANKVWAFMVRNKVVSCQNEYSLSKNEITVLGLKNSDEKTDPFVDMFLAEVYQRKNKRSHCVHLNYVVKKSNACFFDFSSEEIRFGDVTDLGNKKQFFISSKTSFFTIGVGDKIKIGTTTISIKRLRFSQILDKEGVTTTIAKVHSIHHQFVRNKLRQDEYFSEQMMNDFLSDDSDFSDEFGNSAIQV